MRRVGWALAAVGIGLHGASIASAAVSGATTPESNRAYIFDALGAHADSTAAENTISTGCGTQALAHDFHAQAVVGYVGETCSTNRSGAGDMRLFFKRLAGFDGVQHRTSRAALAAGGYSTGAELRELGEPNASGPSIHGAVPLVLTPAVARTDPPDGATIASWHRELAIHFDAAMDDRERLDLAKATGCSSDITRARWRTALTLDLTLKIPKSAANCRVRVTLHAAKLHADPRDGYPAPLDGNQAPSPADGAAPNESNYRLTLIVPGKYSHKREPPKGVPRCPIALVPIRSA